MIALPTAKSPLLPQSLTIPQRLIVSGDFKTELNTHPYVVFRRGKDLLAEGARIKVMDLARKLVGTGVCIKIGPVLSACGYGLINEIHELGLSVMVDLKLNDIPETLSIYGKLLNETKPEIVTVMCTTGVAAMQALKAQLPNSEVFAVTALTSLKDADVRRMYECSIPEVVGRFVRMAQDAGVDGVVASPKEIDVIRECLKRGKPLNIVTPGIRPSWTTVSEDDQNLDRVMTPSQAITAGAHRIVVGRPIIQAKDPHTATMQVIEEITSVVVERESAPI